MTQSLNRATEPQRQFPRLGLQTSRAGEVRTDMPFSANSMRRIARKFRYRAGANHKGAIVGASDSLSAPER